MRKWGLLLALAVVGMLGGCESAGLNNQVAGVRTLDVSPDAGSLSVSLNGQTVTAVINSGDSFPIASQDPTAVQPGTGSYRVFQTNGNVALLTATPTFVANHWYTYLIAGQAETGATYGLRLLTIDDNRSQFAAGTAYLRIVHASVLQPTLDLYITSPTADITTMIPTVTGLSRFTSTGLLAITNPTGAYRIRATTTGTKTVVLDGQLSPTNGSYDIIVACETQNLASTILRAFEQRF